VKTLKWKNKIFNKEKDLNLDIFGNRSPEKDNHYKAEKKKKIIHNTHHHHIAIWYRPKHAP